MKTEEGNRSRVQKQQLEILVTTFHPGKDIWVDMTPTKWQKSSPVRKMNKDIWQAGLECKKVWGKSQLIVFVWVCKPSSCEIWIGHIPQCTIVQCYNIFIIGSVLNLRIEFSRSIALGIRQYLLSYQSESWQILYGLQ